MNHRPLGWLTMAVALTTAIWVVVIMVSMTGTQPSTFEDKIESLSNPTWLYYITYINAALITVLCTAMFSGFYLYCRDRNPLLSMLGLIFVPVYCMGCLIVYLSQIFVVPPLVVLMGNLEKAMTAKVLLEFWIQNWPGTPITILNGLSYAILGIPSILFARIMRSESKGLRFGSDLLGLSGGLSMIAFVGFVLKNPALSFLSGISGVVFLVSLVPIGLHFLCNES